MPSVYGKDRVEQEKNLRNDGMKSLSDEQFDKAKFLKRKYGRIFPNQAQLDKVR